MVARGRQKRDLTTVWTPLHVGPGPAADDVIAQRRAVRIGRHQQSGQLLRVDVDDHTFDHEDLCVAGKRVLPRLQRRRPDVRADQIHLTHAAAVVLEGGDPFRVGRPHEDGRVALGPAGVVRGVAEILDAIGRQLHFLTGRDIADPQVEIANERGAFAVGRQTRCARTAGSAARRAARAPTPSSLPAFRRRRNRSGTALGVVRSTDDAPLAGRIDEQCRGPGRRRRAVPELAVWQPRRLHRQSEHQRRRRRSQELLGPRVVGSGDRGGRLRASALPGHERRREAQQGDETDHIGTLGPKNDVCIWGKSSPSSRRLDLQARGPTPAPRARAARRRGVSLLFSVLSSSSPWPRHPGVASPQFTVFFPVARRVAPAPRSAHDA